MSTNQFTYPSATVAAWVAGGDVVTVRPSQRSPSGFSARVTVGSGVQVALAARAVATLLPFGFVRVLPGRVLALPVAQEAS